MLLQMMVALSCLADGSFVTKKVFFCFVWLGFVKTGMISQSTPLKRSRKQTSPLCIVFP